MKPHAFIFIGRSGCGKGTQVNLFRPELEAKTKMPVLYIETGDMFRNFIKSDGYSQKISKDVYATNKRQPDFLACFMWSTFLVRDFDGASNLILDGTPRSLLEAELLETAFEFYQLPPMNVHIINLNVSREWSEQRLLARGRSDDATLTTIDSRLNWFDKDVMPAIEHFKNSNHHYVEIDSEQTIENVHSAVSEALEGVFVSA